MKISFNLLFLFFFFTVTTFFSQTKIADYEGQWEGNLADNNIFNFSVSLKKIENKKYIFSIFNKHFNFQKTVTSSKNNFIEFDIDNRTSFTGIIEKNTSIINGFISSGIYFYHLKLTKELNETYQGTWNIFLLEKLLSTNIFLSIENVNNGKFDAYPFFGDNRFAGTWCMNSQKEGNIITFQDFRTGLSFKGKLLENIIDLDIVFANTIISSVQLKRSKQEWKFGQYETSDIKKHPLDDGWKTASLKNNSLLKELEDNILSKKIINTHSILIAKKGKIIYEKYFDGFNTNVPHDQRSASKSISSAMIGIAIDNNILKSENQLLYDFIPEKHQKTKDSLKSSILLKDLLTMSSGLDVLNKASEQSYQNSQNWLQTVLKAPMLHKPGVIANYGSANPYLLGTVLNKTVSIPLQLYMDQELFKPLGISNYAIQKEMTGKPYFGGGMYITPRDMLKFGQLYLCNGKWNGKRIISKKWVQKSFKNYHNLANVKDKNGYGYLWWHHLYTVNKKKIQSIEARGNGGQYIFIIPKLKSVCVITAGNYKNGKTKQPEHIFEKYILPQLLN